MTDLESKIETRHRLLTELLALTRQQEMAIHSHGADDSAVGSVGQTPSPSCEITHAGMDELMRVLDKKQALVDELVAVSQQLKRDFESLASARDFSDEHRVIHDQCNRLHRELLAREAACEASLTSAREHFAGYLRSRGVYQSASRYTQSDADLRPQGGRLDIFSD